MAPPASPPWGTPLVGAAAGATARCTCSAPCCGVLRGVMRPPPMRRTDRNTRVISSPSSRPIARMEGLGDRNRQADTSASSSAMDRRCSGRVAPCGGVAPASPTLQRYTRPLHMPIGPRWAYPDPPEGVVPPYRLQRIRQRGGVTRQSRTALRRCTGRATHAVALHRAATCPSGRGGPRPPTTQARNLNSCNPTGRVLVHAVRVAPPGVGPECQAARSTAGWVFFACGSRPWLDPSRSSPPTSRV